MHEMFSNTSGRLGTETKDILSNIEPSMKINVIYKKACTMKILPLDLYDDISMITGDNKIRPNKCKEEFMKADIL